MGDFDQFPFPLQPLAPGLAETGADDDDGRNPFLAALLQHGRHEAIGDDDHRQVHRVGDVQHGGVGWQAQDLAGPGVDRVEVALVAAFFKISQHRVAQFLRVAGSADDGDRFGMEECVEHRILLSFLDPLRRLVDGTQLLHRCHHL